MGWDAPPESGVGRPKGMESIFFLVRQTPQRGPFGTEGETEAGSPLLQDWGFGHPPGAPPALHGILHVVTEVCKEPPAAQEGYVATRGPTTLGGCSLQPDKSPVLGEPPIPIFLARDQLLPPVAHFLATSGSLHCPSDAGNGGKQLLSLPPPSSFPNCCLTNSAYRSLRNGGR